MGLTTSKAVPYCQTVNKNLLSVDYPDGILRTGLFFNLESYINDLAGV